MTYIVRSLTIVIICAICWNVGTLAYAQQNDAPFLQIAQVDSTNFPIVELVIVGGNLTSDIEALPLTVLEDGVEQAILADQTLLAAYQLAIVLDPRSLLETGQSGQTHRTEATAAMLHLVEQEVLLRNLDTVAAYTFQPDGSLQTIQGWTGEPNLIFNSLVDATIEDGSETMPLADLLLPVMDQFEGNAGSARSAPSILLFSTGVGAFDVDTTVVRANERNIRMDTVELAGPGPEADPAGPLAQLARQTGGRSIRLASTSAMEQIGRHLNDLRSQRVLSYQSNTPAATVKVSTALPDGSLLESQARERTAAAALQPVQVTIMAPAPEEAVEWEAVPANASLDSLPPEQLTIRAAFTWPDGRERELSQVSYVLSGPSRFRTELVQREPPFGEVTFEIDPPQEGTYTLKIEATDQFGLQGIATNPQLRIVRQGVAAEPAPVATPPAQSATGANEPAVAESDTASAEVALTVAVDLAQELPPTGERVTVPGTSVALPRNLLQLALPILIVFLALFLYWDVRERKSHARQKGQTNARGSTGPGRFYDLSEPSEPLQPLAKTKDKLKDFRLHGEEDLQVREAEAWQPPSRPAAQPAQRTLVQDEEDDEVTVVPPIFGDDDATYRLSDEVERPIIGYFVRVSGSPNLPAELPIYGLNPTRGEARQIYIGRHSKNNSVVINDKSISREHAVIIQKEGRLYLRDQASTAGTFLNWRRLQAGEELLLRHNDLISFGEVVYEFRARGEDEATVAGEDL